MSRVANSPVALPSGVEVKLSGHDISVKGAKGEMGFAIHDLVELVQEESELKVRAKSEERGATAMAGTMRAIVQNMVKGVSEGFEKKLELQGVGYRAQAQDKKLTLLSVRRWLMGISESYGAKAVQVVDEFTCPAGLPVSGVIRAGLSCQSMVMAMSGLTR